MANTILPYSSILGHIIDSYPAKEAAYVATAAQFGAAIDFPATRAACYASAHPILALAEFVRRQRLEIE